MKHSHPEILPKTRSKKKLFHQNIDQISNKFPPINGKNHHLRRNFLSTSNANIQSLIKFIQKVRAFSLIIMLLLATNWAVCALQQ